ncbi:MAG TPA: hypothetical protein ENG03_01795 [Thioploca sp.]|nr:MAG: hypothetical protein DRR19_17625 [Gammaproteobacteria bacterium]HDN25832.1 hypothetical protein [Thioploca sp.]
MSGFDLLIDQKLEANKLQKAISQVLEVEPENILVCNEVSDVPLATSISSLVVLAEVLGEFVLLLAFYFKESYVGIDSPIEIAKRLSTKLECQCLISDDEINPYTMLRVDIEAHVQQVALSVASLQEDKYVVEYVVRDV